MWIKGQPTDLFANVTDRAILSLWVKNAWSNSINILLINMQEGRAAHDPSKEWWKPRDLQIEVK